MYKTAIIGGGASGLAAATMLSDIFRDDVILLERLPRVGKKLAATGNGRGNVTNVDLSAEHYHSMEGDAVRFVMPALSAFGNRETEIFLNSLGAMTAVENGKVYPASMQASSIVDLFRLRLQNSRAEVVNDFFVRDIQWKNGEFAIASDSGTVRAEAVILAAGGKCHKEFGTDGSGYLLAERLGHTVTQFAPSLVQLKTQTANIRALRGIKQTARLTLYDGNVPIICEKGDLLFTEYGVSGDAVFRLSGHAAACDRPVLSVEFMPDVGAEELTEFLLKKAESAPYLSVGDLLTGCMNKLTGRAVAAYACLDVNEKCRKSHIKPLVGAVKDFRMPVVGSLGFNDAQVTRGGVRLAEVDPATMRSKRREGLYIVGELLDIDGDCGGYNLQWAFSSAFLAASAIAKKYGKTLDFVR